MVSTTHTAVQRIDPHFAFLPLVFAHCLTKPLVKFIDAMALLGYAEHFSGTFPAVSSLLRALNCDLDGRPDRLRLSLDLYQAWLDASPDEFAYAERIDIESEPPVLIIGPRLAFCESLSKPEFLIRLSTLKQPPYLIGALFAATRQLYHERAGLPVVTLDTKGKQPVEYGRRALLDPNQAGNVIAGLYGGNSNKGEARKLKIEAARALQMRSTGDRVATGSAHSLLNEIIAKDEFDLEARLALLRVWLDSPAVEVESSAELPNLIDVCLRLDPSSSEAWYARGMLCQHLGELHEAESAYRRVLEISPGHISAQFRLWTMVPHFKPALCPRSIREYSLDTGTHIATINSGEAIVLRDALPQSAVENVAGDLAPLLLEWYPSRIEQTTAPWYFDDVPLHLRQRLDSLIQTHLAGTALARISKYRRAGWRPTADPNRRVQMHGPFPRHFMTSPIHSDGPVAGRRDDFVTFWIPLTACGPGIAPSLKIVPLAFEEPLVAAEYSFGVINEVSQYRLCAFVERFCNDGPAPISIRPGDVVAMGRYVLHATYHSETERNDRISCDVRYSCGPAAFGSVLLPQDFE